MAYARLQICKTWSIYFAVCTLFEQIFRIYFFTIFFFQCWVFSYFSLNIYERKLKSNVFRIFFPITHNTIQFFNLIQICVVVVQLCHFNVKKQRWTHSAICKENCFEESSENSMIIYFSSNILDPLKFKMTSNPTLRHSVTYLNVKYIFYYVGLDHDSWLIRNFYIQ